MRENADLQIEKEVDKFQIKKISLKGLKNVEEGILTPHQGPDLHYLKSTLREDSIIREIKAMENIFQK